MSKEEGYQTLVNEHRRLLQFGRKFRLSGGILQFSILIFVNAWKHLEFPCYKLAAPILLGWCFYQFAKDFFTLLKVDSYGSQLISDGIALEIKDASLGKYFHEILHEFNLIKILLQRSLVNFIAFGCLAYFLSQLIIEFNPELVISRGLLIFLTATITSIASQFYYGALKSIAKTRSSALN